MPDPIYSNVVNLLQLAIMLLIPLEILLAATLRIKADYDMRDTLATMMVSLGSIYSGACWVGFSSPGSCSLTPTGFSIFPLPDGPLQSPSCSRTAATTGGIASVTARVGSGPLM